MVHKTNKMAVQYIPGIIATLSTVLFKAFVISYNRIIPYVAMASVPSDEGFSQSKARRLNRMTSFTNDVGALAELIKDKEYLLLFTNVISNFSVFVLTPLKNSVFILSEDPTGWSLSVSSASGIMIIGIYTLLLFSLGGSAMYLWNKPTGLKWDPASLAAQLSLAYNSNIRGAFNGLEFCDYRATRKPIADWSDQFGVLRLGYWRKMSDPREIVYGVRFIQYDFGTKRLVSGPMGVPCSNYDGSCALNGGLYHVFHQRMIPRRCLPQPYSEAEVALSGEGNQVCSLQYARYNVGRAFLFPIYRLAILLVGVTCIVFTAVNMVSRRIYDPIYYPSGITGNSDSLQDTRRRLYVSVFTWSVIFFL